MIVTKGNFFFWVNITLTIEEKSIIK